MGRKKRKDREPSAPFQASRWEAALTQVRAALARLATPHDAEDLRSLAFFALLVLATWVALLGWTPSFLLGGEDVPCDVTWSYRELCRQGGNAARVLYRPEELGGCVLRDAYPTLALPVNGLFAALGASAATSSNLLVFVCQIVVGFLGARAARDIAGVASPAPEGPPARASFQELLGRVGRGWILAFAPFLIWRLGYGGVSQIVGALLFTATLSVVAAMRTRTLSSTLWAVALLAHWHAFTSNSKQLVLYSVLAGGPIILALAFTAGARRAEGLRACAVGGFVALLGLAVAAPIFAPVLARATGSDAARALGGPSVIYGATVATLRDWISSLTFGVELVPSGRTTNIIHETNFPLGPILPLLGLLPWRLLKLVACGLGLAAAFVLTLSMDLEPFSRALRSLVPALEAFRVPSRSGIVLVGSLPILAIAGLEVLQRGATPGAAPRNGRAIAGALAIAGVLLVPAVPALVRELISWGLVLVAVVPRTRAALERRCARGLWAPLLALVVGAASVSAFRERLCPFTRMDEVVRVPDEIGRKLRAIEPSLARPLTRVALQEELPLLGPGTTAALDLSGIDGYWAPQRRFAELDAALNETPYEPLETFYRFGPRVRSFTAIRQLYNVRFTGRWTGPQGPWVVPLGDTAGEVWSPTELVPVASVVELGRLLWQKGDGLAAAARDTAWFLSSAPVLNEVTLPRGPLERASNLTLEGERGAQAFRVSLAPPKASSLVVLATNYDHVLQARTGSGSSLPVFPVYGALAGVLVPPGTSTFVLEAVSPAPASATVAALLGWALALAGLVVVRRPREPLPS